MASDAGGSDNGAMSPLSPAERKRNQRARQKAGETLPTCSNPNCVAKAKLQPNLRMRLDRLRDGLCWNCWIHTPAGREAERERGRRTREADPERARELARERARRFRQRILDRARSRGAV